MTMTALWRCTCIALGAALVVILAGCMATLPSEPPPPQSAFVLPTATSGLLSDPSEPAADIPGGSFGASVPSPVVPTAQPTEQAPPSVVPTAQPSEQASPSVVPTVPTLSPTRLTFPIVREPVATPVAATVSAGGSVVVPTLPAISYEERWRQQQRARAPFAAARPYHTPGSELWWYDPVQQQHVILGTISGPFVAQARFVLARQGVHALEVPYQVNRSYGLTSLSPALLERIAATGATEWIETYVFERPDVRLQGGE